MIDTLKADHERIDVLINNAGHALRAPSVDYPMDDWDRLIELNLTAPFLLSRGLAPPMLQRGAGKVIFTASLWSFLGGRSVPAYTVTKSGIAGMIRALSNEWAPQGVQVNGIAPGYIDTDLTRPAINDPEIGPAFLSRIPAGRWGEPRDVAGAALFLASHHFGLHHRDDRPRRRRVARPLTRRPLPRAARPCARNLRRQTPTPTPDTVNIPRVMTGVQLVGNGGLDQLILRHDIPVPHPQADEVLIRVGASSGQQHRHQHTAPAGIRTLRMQPTPHGRDNPFLFPASRVPTAAGASSRPDPPWIHHASANACSFGQCKTH